MMTGYSGITVSTPAEDPGISVAPDPKQTVGGPSQPYAGSKVRQGKKKPKRKPGLHPVNVSS